MINQVYFRTFKTMLGSKTPSVDTLVAKTKQSKESFYQTFDSYGNFRRELNLWSKNWNADQRVHVISSPKGRKVKVSHHAVQRILERQIAKSSNLESFLDSGLMSDISEFKKGNELSSYKKYQHIGRFFINSKEGIVLVMTADLSTLLTVYRVN